MVVSVKTAARKALTAVSVQALANSRALQLPVSGIGLSVVLGPSVVLGLEPLER